MPTLAVGMPQPPTAAEFTAVLDFRQGHKRRDGQDAGERQRLVFLVLALGMVMVVIGWARDPGVWRGLDRLMGGGSKPPARCRQPPRRRGAQGLAARRVSDAQGGGDGCKAATSGRGRRNAAGQRPRPIRGRSSANWASATATSTGSATAARSDRPKSRRCCG